MLRKLQGCGATMHALITDIESNFMQLSRELGISTENSIFLLMNLKYYLYLIRSI